MLSRWPGTAEASLHCGGVEERNKRKCGKGGGDDGKGKERKRNYLFLNISEISFHFRYVRLIYWDALSSGLTAVRGFQFKKIGIRIINYLVSELR